VDNIWVRLERGAKSGPSDAPASGAGASDANDAIPDSSHSSYLLAPCPILVVALSDNAQPLLPASSELRWQLRVPRERASVQVEMASKEHVSMRLSFSDYLRIMDLLEEWNHSQARSRADHPWVVPEVPGEGANLQEASPSAQTSQNRTWPSPSNEDNDEPSAARIASMMAMATESRKMPINATLLGADGAVGIERQSANLIDPDLEYAPTSAWRRAGRSLAWFGMPECQTDPAPLHPDEYELSFPRDESPGIQFGHASNQMYFVSQVIPWDGVHPRHAAACRLVRAGDMLMAIDGIPIRGIPKSDLRTLIRSRSDSPQTILRFRSMPHSLNLSMPKGVHIVVTNDADRDFRAPCITLRVDAIHA